MSSHKFYLLKDFWGKLDETSKSFGYLDRFYFLGNKKIKILKSRNQEITNNNDL